MVFHPIKTKELRLWKIREIIRYLVLHPLRIPSTSFDPFLINRNISLVNNFFETGENAERELQF